MPSILNFSEALKVASLCFVYSSPEEVGAMIPIEFVSKLVESATEGEILFLLSLSNSTDLEVQVSEIATRIVQSGLLELLDFYSQIGGK